MARTATKILLVLLLVSCIAKAQGKSSRGEVLVVVSSENAITLKGGKKHPTGFFLNELGIPVKALADAGYEPIICDPLGNTPAMDVNSDKPSYFGDDADQCKKIDAFVHSLWSFKHPLSLSKIAKSDLSQYKGIFVPGGHAPMEDLWDQPDLGKILTYFHDNQKPTALICHGPIALLSTAKSARNMASALERKTSEAVKAETVKSGTVEVGTTKSAAAKLSAQSFDWPYKGYLMTVFSDAEEKPNEPDRLGGFMKFYPEDALKAAGATVVVSPPKQSHVVRDRELITGQNPFSDKELAEAFLKELSAWELNQINRQRHSQEIPQ